MEDLTAAPRIHIEGDGPTEFIGRVTIQAEDRLENWPISKLIAELQMKNGIPQSLDYRDALFREALVRILTWQRTP